MPRTKVLEKMKELAKPKLVNLSLSDSLLDSVSSLLSQDHNLESFKVRQSGTCFTLSNLLSPSGRAPLFSDTSSSPFLRDGSSSGTSWQGESQWSQNNVTQVDSLTSNASLWTIDQSTLLVNDFDNSSQLASGWTLLDQNNTTNYN